MKVGLLFGSFNPIHMGHIAIANYMAESTDLAQIWLVVSPQNPLKEKKSLADAKKRFAQVKKAIGKHSKIKVCDVEFKLPQPSYTIHTLEVLKKKYPKNKFTLIIGSDNLRLFHKWKNYEKILKDYRMYVYPRTGYDGGEWKNHPKIKFADATKIDVSSTLIRRQMKQGKDVKGLLA